MASFLKRDYCHFTTVVHQLSSICATLHLQDVTILLLHNKDQFLHSSGNKKSSFTQVSSTMNRLSLLLIDGTQVGPFVQQQLYHLRDKSIS